jgi:hypothetical protein
MAKKEWYSIEIECIKETATFDMLLGEKQVIAKVKSMGLACFIVASIEKLYKNNCIITIK